MKLPKTIRVYYLGCDSLGATTVKGGGEGGVGDLKNVRGMYDPAKSDSAIGQWQEFGGFHFGLDYYLGADGGCGVQDCVNGVLSDRMHGEEVKLGFTDRADMSAPTANTGTAAAVKGPRRGATTTKGKKKKRKKSDPEAPMTLTAETTTPSTKTNNNNPEDMFETMIFNFEDAKDSSDEESEGNTQRAHQDGEPVGVAAAATAATAAAATAAAAAAASQPKIDAKKSSAEKFAAKRPAKSIVLSSRAGDDGNNGGILGTGISAQDFISSVGLTADMDCDEQKQLIEERLLEIGSNARVELTTAPPPYFLGDSSPIPRVKEKIPSAKKKSAAYNQKDAGSAAAVRANPNGFGPVTVVVANPPHLDCGDVLPVSENRTQTFTARELSQLEYVRGEKGRRGLVIPTNRRPEKKKPVCTPSSRFLTSICDVALHHHAPLCKGPSAAVRGAGASSLSSSSSSSSSTTKPKIIFSDKTSSSSSSAGANSISSSSTKEEAPSEVDGVVTIPLPNGPPPLHTTVLVLPRTKNSHSVIDQNGLSGGGVLATSVMIRFEEFHDLSQCDLSNLVVGKKNAVASSTTKRKGLGRKDTAEGDIGDDSDGDSENAFGEEDFSHFTLQDLHDTVAELNDEEREIWGFEEEEEEDEDEDGDGEERQMGRRVRREKIKFHRRPGKTLFEGLLKAERGERGDLRVRRGGMEVEEEEEEGGEEGGDEQDHMQEEEEGRESGVGNNKYYMKLERDNRGNADKNTVKKGTTSFPVHCPRCMKTVPENNNWSCVSCGELSFQCRRCRHINYEASSGDGRCTYFCTACGYSPNGEFDFALGGEVVTDGTNVFGGCVANRGDAERVADALSKLLKKSSADSKNSTKPVKAKRRNRSHRRNGHYASHIPSVSEDRCSEVFLLACVKPASAKPLLKAAELFDETYPMAYGDDETQWDTLAKIMSPQPLGGAFVGALGKSAAANKTFFLKEGDKSKRDKRAAKNVNGAARKIIAWKAGVNGVNADACVQPFLGICDDDDDVGDEEEDYGDVDAVGAGEGGEIVNLRALCVEPFTAKNWCAIGGSVRVLAALLKKPMADVASLAKMFLIEGVFPFLSSGPMLVENEEELAEFRCFLTQVSGIVEFHKILSEMLEGETSTGNSSSVDLRLKIALDLAIFIRCGGTSLFPATKIGGVLLSLLQFEGLEDKLIQNILSTLKLCCLENTRDVKRARNNGEITIAGTFRKIILAEGRVMELFSHDNAVVRRAVFRLFTVIAAEERSEKITETTKNGTGNTIAIGIFECNKDIVSFEGLAAVVQIIVSFSGWACFKRMGGSDLLIDKICEHAQAIYRSDCLTLEKIDVAAVEESEAALLCSSILLVKMLNSAESGGLIDSVGGVSAVAKLTLANEVLSSFEFRESERTNLAKELLNGILNNV